eukprot:scaffold25188_cov94-Skeletonema_dohrnii-CCMP3373.AAC.1
MSSTCAVPQDAQHIIVSSDSSAPIIAEINAAADYMTRIAASVELIYQQNQSLHFDFVVLSVVLDCSMLKLRPSDTM